MDYATGIDLSLTGTGMAIHGDSGWRTKLFKSVGHKGDTLVQRQKRVHKMFIQITDWVSPDTPIVIEQPAYSQNGGSHHDRSGLWWLVVEFLISEGWDVTELVPGKPKKFLTGSGTASKTQVIAAAIKRFPDADVIDDNVADAIGLAAMLSAARGYLDLDDFPKVNQEAMKGIVW